MGLQTAERPKYILIISQYYHSRHAFVIEAPTEDAEYYTKARSMIEELEKHKRTGGYREDRETDYGDMAEKYFSGTSRRYNVNDSGDIYLIPCWNLLQAMAHARSYWEDTYRESRGYKKNAVLEAIGRCHRWDDVKTIIGNHFTVL